MSELPLETPVEDLLEQGADTDPDRPSRSALPDEVPLEADPADVAEQADEVPLAEDDYR
jgi:hypothetical protein